MQNLEQRLQYAIEEVKRVKRKLEAEKIVQKETSKTIECVQYSYSYRTSWVEDNNPAGHERKKTMSKEIRVIVWEGLKGTEPWSWWEKLFANLSYEKKEFYKKITTEPRIVPDREKINSALKRLCEIQESSEWFIVRYLAVKYYTDYYLSQNYIGEPEHRTGLLSAFNRVLTELYEESKKPDKKERAELDLRRFYQEHYLH